jgi:hypothetical protein
VGLRYRLLLLLLLLLLSSHWLAAPAAGLWLCGRWHAGTLRRRTSWWVVGE